MNGQFDLATPREHGKIYRAYHKALHIFTMLMYCIGLVWTICKVWELVFGL